MSKTRKNIKKKVKYTQKAGSNRSFKTCLIDPEVPIIQNLGNDKLIPGGNLLLFDWECDYLTDKKNREICNKVFSNTEKLIKTLKEVDDLNSLPEEKKGGKQIQLSKNLEYLQEKDSEFKKTYKDLFDTNGITPFSEDLKKFSESYEVYIKKLQEKTRRCIEFLMIEYEKSIKDSKHEIRCRDYMDDRKKEWIKCSDECVFKLQKLVKRERETTGFWLNLIKNSLFIYDQSKPVNIQFYLIDKNTPLTGLWEIDNVNIKFYINDYNRTQYGGILNFKRNTNSKINSKIDLNNNLNDKTVLGFGPSACGKTYSGKVLLEALSKLNNNFPNNFISIDGGIVRESSVVYQTILKCNKKYILKNMIVRNVKEAVKKKTRFLKNYKFLPDFIHNPLSKLSKRSGAVYDAEKVKGNLVEYLKTQRKQGVNFSVYVPETLTACLSKSIVKSCKNYYKKFIDLTHDKNWIGILIWQHKFRKNCMFKDKYKCNGCSESGMSREDNEGKLYSNSSWEKAYNHGLEEIENAGLGISFHNCGRPDGISLLNVINNKENLDLNKANFKDFLNTKNIEIVEKNCEELPKYSPIRPVNPPKVTSLKKSSINSRNKSGNTSRKKSRPILSQHIRPRPRPRPRPALTTPTLSVSLKSRSPPPPPRPLTRPSPPPIPSTKPTPKPRCRLRSRPSTKPPPPPLVFSKSRYRRPTPPIPPRPRP